MGQLKTNIWQKRRKGRGGVLSNAQHSSSTHRSMGFAFRGRMCPDRIRTAHLTLGQQNTHSKTPTSGWPGRILPFSLSGLNCQKLKGTKSKQVRNSEHPNQSQWRGGSLGQADTFKPYCFKTLKQMFTPSTFVESKKQIQHSCADDYVSAVNGTRICH